MNEHVIVGDVVEKLGWAGKSHKRVAEEVRNNGTEPVTFGNHVGIKSGDELTSTAGKFGDKVGATNQVTSLCMVRLALDLDTSEIIGVGVLVAELFHSLFEFGVGTVVKNNDAETILGVIVVASSTGGVEDDVNVFFTASDEGVDCGSGLTFQTELRTLTTLETEKRVDLVEESRD